MFLEGLRIAPMEPTLLRLRGIGVFCFLGESLAIARLSHLADPPIPGLFKMSPVTPMTAGSNASRATGLSEPVTGHQ